MKINLRERLQNLKTVAALANFLKEPDQLESVFKIASSMEESDLLNYMRETLLQDQQMKALISERWQPPKYTLEELQRLPEGTLGNIYANQLISLNLSPDDLLPKGEINTDTDYIQLRARQTHDIIHVITGFKTDEIGEISLQAFNLAQFKSPVAALIIFGGILTVLKRKGKHDMEELLDAITKGFALGRGSTILITQKLEEEWSSEIDELRKRYQINTST